MADNTKIEWADASWSPITGCDPISAGCENCYARRMARRLGGRFGYSRYPNHFDVTFHPDRLDQPLKWRKPRRIFVCSMGDLFHEDVEWNWQYKVFEIMFINPDHIYLVLTKRPERMKNVLSDIWFHLGRNYPYADFPFKNLWFGVTAENQKLYEERWIIASKISATVKFVSLEPALEHIDIDIFAPWPDWVIWGPETGPGKRPFKNEWAESVFEQCREKNIPFFDKRKNYLAREFPG